MGTREGRHREQRHVPVDREILEAGFHHGATYYEHQAFLKAVRSGSAPEVDVRAGLLAVAIGCAAQQSIDEGRPVQMSELGL